MVKQYSKVELVSPYCPEYLAWGRRNRKIHKGYKDSDKYKKDIFESDYQKAIRKWEHVLRSLLSKSICEYDHRILRYTENKIGTFYREIDFIARPDAKTLVFCEFKLKDRYKLNIGSKPAGWSQLNKSISIAQNCHDHLYGLSICVDMSHVYALQSSASIDTYDSYLDIQSHLPPSGSKRVIWLNSAEIARAAVEFNILTDGQIDDMALLYRQKNDPMSLLDGSRDTDFHNTPLDKLRTLKIWK
jgi:hypothetical protein